PWLVDQLEPLARQVVLVVTEVRDRRRRDPLLVEGKRIDPGPGRADVEVVALPEAELAGEAGKTIRESGRGSHQLEPLAVRDAVEVDAGLDPPELAGDFGIEDPCLRADATDLLGREADEDQGALVAAGGEPRSNPAHAFDARRVVDDPGT